MTVNSRIGDDFPVGMRVLAVDDNPTCLMVLETLLRKCNYHVTTTSQAITALNLLRENKDEFDLVISDVDMPDMDGFMLLEYVGLEMDLPVIMLSSYGDKELVMKGITHGACDYLLKPVRIEELKNIWQHVIRRKKLDYKERKTSDKSHRESGEVPEEFKVTENTDHNVKPNKKRKDQNNEEDEEFEETGQQYEDSSTQKKPRVVWTPDLHRKFVAAVNKLGLDQAVPKKILELMNDEKLTRENVASHLQKYRLYLKKYCSVAIQQANMVAAFGCSDSACRQLLDGVIIQNLGGVGQTIDAGYRSYPAASVPSGLNATGGLGLCGLSSSGVIQWGQAGNLMDVVNHEPDIDSRIQTGNQSMLHGVPMPTPLGFENRQQNKDITAIAEFCSTNLVSLANTVTSDFSVLNVNGERNLGFVNNTVMLEEHLLNDSGGGGFGNQLSTAATSSSTLDFSSKLPKFECKDNWPAAVQSQSFLHEQASSSDSRDNMPTSAAHVVINPHEVSPLSLVVNTSADVKTYLPCQKHPVRDDINHNSTLDRNILNQEFCHQSNHAFSPGDSIVIPRAINNLFCQSHEFHINDDPFARQLDSAKLTDMDLKLEKPPINYSYNSARSTEDLVNIMKQV